MLNSGAKRLNNYLLVQLSFFITENVDSFVIASNCLMGANGSYEVNLHLTIADYRLNFGDPKMRSQYCDYATGWMIRCSNLTNLYNHVDHLSAYPPSY
jgi:hypothetical protein